MTKLRDLDDLATVTEARYEQRRQSFARLVAEENRIRGELAHIDEMDLASRDDSPGAIPMRAIGADVIWQGWMGRARASLNMELARVLAVKETHLLEVRRAYGKVLVVRELRADLIQRRQKETAASALAAAIDQSLMRQ